ncbi:hypothetical protein G6F70_005379 [Rhizopus microsporus]|nr:hypothetical protein G6F71_007533 [Rhizopus microsporus]KAG1198938.1 hypothetical protein G6F70_005379 [Rhizopus microsporus]KAG1211638.1 hypothetical protein G6F69_004419 [Rhizopus microsporus]KAG1232479.1 hypothetical protein G6F67_004997 [Rhizopus microsporus]KAG1261159.1 hypothetical protein G6F68_006888 [Rhizopus microsporus]
MPKNVPFRRIILDLCKRDQTFGCLIPLPNNDSSSTALCAIRKGLFPRRRTVQTTLQFIPEISRIAFGPPRDLSILGSQVSVPDRFDNVSFLDALMYSLDNLKPHAEIQCSTYSDCQGPSWSASGFYGTKTMICLHNRAIRLWLCLVRCFFDLSTGKLFGT